VGDTVSAVTDDRSGIGEALAAVFLAITLQACFVQLINDLLYFALLNYDWSLAPALISVCNDNR
jgi:hypothetical protein